MNRPIFLIEDLSQQRLPARTVAAVLRQTGLPTRLFDSAQLDANSFIPLTAQAQPHLIVFSVLFADRIAEYLAWMTELRAAGVHAHITMMGALPALASATLLNTCPALDSILCNEPTATITQLANACHDSTQWQQIPGIAYRSPTPQINPIPPPIHVDNLPFALRDSPISNFPLPTGPLQFATVVASRGCYHECSFCLPCTFYRKQGRRYRLRSISNLMDEMELLYRDGVRLFLFDDEQFLPPRGAREKRIAEFADELQRRNMQIAFTIKCRADDVDAALVRELQNLGLLRVYIGIESGHQPTLDWIEKHTTVQQNTDALKTLDQIGVIANFQNLMFHPFATLESIRAELEFLQSVIPFTSTLFSFREIEMYAGTPLAERCHSEHSARSHCIQPDQQDQPWLTPYIIADARAELLRRMNRVVFASSYPKSQDALDLAWFNTLMQKRFDTQFDPTQIHHLKIRAAKTNRAMVDVWHAMIEFAETKDIYDAEHVNTQVADWSRKIKIFQVLETWKI